ncbi:MAG: CbiX/SirB N-terminal domain-containing protein [Acidobacteria bacterium]|nr:CbiX/SirB N-terminal domain-containing protein [Acidobacteriota bacterium]
MKTGIIVFAHGSSVESANSAVGDVVNEVAREGGYALASPAFLELAHPDLPEAVAQLSSQGAHRIVVVPYFLTPGIHLTRDLPRIVAQLQQQHPNLVIDVTPPLDGHPALRQIILERAQKALEC